MTGKAAADEKKKKTAEYGSWSSPISAESLVKSTRMLAEIQLDPTANGKGKVYWVEVRFSEGGRGVVCSRDVDGGQVETWTPASFNSRSKVHEYGGGSFLVHDGLVYFVNFADQRFYQQTAPNSTPTPITPPDKNWRFADGHFAHDSIFCIIEDHSGVESGERKEAKNSLARICLKSHSITLMAEGADFYASPRVSPDGGFLVWMQWNHPNMPWDKTELWMLELSERGEADGRAWRAAGEDAVNFQFPRFSPNGAFLCIHDRSDWWNVYEMDPMSSTQKRNVYPCPKEIGEPHWQFGGQPFAFDPADSDRLVFSCQGKLMLLNLKTSEAKGLDTGYSSHFLIWFDQTSNVICLASHPHKSSAIIAFNTDKFQVKEIRKSREDEFPHEYLSTPREIRFSSGESHAFGYFYEPKNADFEASTGTLPPLLVMVHGGPTAQASTALDLKKQFWTSRGFAVLDVNYRGSTGYGRRFRDELKTKFGVVDIEDCCNGARYLADEGLVDRQKLCIAGGSSGGYVVLMAVLVPHLFSAAVSRYGISDLEALQMDSHKFEAQYNCSLIAPYPEGAEIYKQRSPLTHLDKVSCPVAFFQGLEDKVVPPLQTKRMFEAVKAKGLGTALMEFPDEGHGFRKAENVRECVEAELEFFCRVLGIPNSDEPKLEIFNAPGCR